MFENAALALDVLQALLAHEKLTYALLKNDLSLCELAPNFKTFLNQPNIQEGQSAVEIFDALVGSEQAIRDALKEKDAEYKIEYIYFSPPNLPLRYISLYIWAYLKNAERYFLLITEDVTSAALIEQHTIQARNELRLLHARLEQANTNLQHQAFHNALTDLPNRRYLEDVLLRYIEFARRYQSPLSCIMLDIDDFKTLNDTYGHPFGDEGLRVLAGVVLESKRSADFAARYGGGEICVFMPMVDISESRAFAERLQKQLAQKLESFPHRFTISAGIASLTANVTNAAELIQSADEALYRAKRVGKNCICVVGEE